MDPEDTGNDAGGELSVDAGGDAQPDVQPEAQAGEQSPWGGPSQEEWQAQQNALAQLAHGFGQYSPVLQQIAEVMNTPQHTEQEIPGIDPYDPDSFEPHIQARIEQGIAQRLGPIEPVLQQIQVREQHELIRGHLDGLAKQIGEFDLDRAEHLALLYQNTGMGMAEALYAAGQAQRQFEQSIASRALEQQKQSLEAVGAAAKESGAALGASEVTKPYVGRDWARINARNGAA